MAITARPYTPVARSHQAIRRQAIRSLQQGWGRLLDAITELQRVAEVGTEIEQAGPQRRVKLAQGWLRELR